MKFKKLATLALSTMVVASMGSTAAFADEPATPTGGVDNSYLVKYLKIADGVEAPNATFTFQFAKAETEGKAEAADYPAAPADQTIKVSDMEDAKIANTKDMKGMIKLADIFTVPKVAGEYAYTVTEAQSGLTGDSDAKTTEKMDYDGQTYTVRLYVVNKEDGSGTAIDKFTVANDKGEKVDPTDTDPTPGTNETRDDSEYKADGFTFTNNYTVTTKNDPGTDPTNPDDPLNPTYGGFGVSKEVKGKYADKKNDTFTFTVKIVKPIGSTATKGKYMVGGKEEEFTYDTSFTTTLKHGQNFGISEMELGSTVTIEEAAAANYTAAVSGLFSKTMSKKEQACGADVVLGSANKGQVAKYVNTMDDTSVTPTGIVINNLPYVLLIVIALGGIVLFTRKKREE